MIALNIPTRRRILVAGGALALGEAPQARSASSDAAQGGIVALLGDSVFDNKAYVGNGPDVVAQLREQLAAAGATAILAAVDGASARDVPAQLARVPKEAEWIIVSAGGNDALAQEGVLGKHVRSVADALNLLAAVRAKFAQDYRRMLDAVAARGARVAVCTIYEPRFPEPRRRISSIGLTAFNDVITRAAFARRLPLLDLRLICDQDEDFANPIEPSVRGGAKIAGAIAALVASGGSGAGRSVVFAGSAEGVR
jgi:lysophospholipase L1-like esterase